jgi:ribose transport system permease protein
VTLRTESRIGIDNAGAESQGVTPLGANGARTLTMKRVLVNCMGIGLFLAGVVLYFSITTPLFLSVDNVDNILSNSAVIGLVAVGQTFVIISGGFDLSVAGTVPLACVLYVEWCNSGMPTGVALVAVLLLGAVIGILNGVLICGLRINALIATLAMMSIGVGAAYSFAHGTTMALNRISAGWIADNLTGQLGRQVLVCAAIALLAAGVLRFTVYGRSLYAIGGNREASRLAGIRVGLSAGSVYVISGVLAALAGIVISSQILEGSAGVGSDTALTSVAAVVLGGAAITGGKGSVLGTIGGVLVLGCLENGMDLVHVQPFYQQIGTGLALLAAVIFSQIRNHLIDQL